MGVSSGNGTKLGVALLMGSGAIIMRMLGTKTPAACLPEGTLLLDVVGVRLVAFEAIGELGFASPTPLA